MSRLELKFQVIISESLRDEGSSVMGRFINNDSAYVSMGMDGYYLKIDNIEYEPNNNTESPNFYVNESSPYLLVSHSEGYKTMSELVRIALDKYDIVKKLNNEKLQQKITLEELKVKAAELSQNDRVKLSICIMESLKR